MVDFAARFGPATHHGQVTFSHPALFESLAQAGQGIALPAQKKRARYGAVKAMDQVDFLSGLLSDPVEYRFRLILEDPALMDRDSGGFVHRDQRAVFEQYRVRAHAGTRYALDGVLANKNPAEAGLKWCS
jgi:hypothetical protein